VNSGARHPGIRAGNGTPSTLPTRTEDWITLGKPEITLLVLATVLAGYTAGSAAGPLDLRRLVWTLTGAALASVGTAALNMLLEHPWDARMRRTSRRPIPAGRITPLHASWFGGVAAGAGVAMLWIHGSPLAGLLTALTTGIYLLAYVPMKRTSDWCVAVGAIPGALPPAIGFAAAAGRICPEVVALFLIQFTWQVPHFTAIAWLHREDYARVGWKMLPAGDPDGAAAARRVVGWGLALLAVSFIPAYFDSTGGLYLTGAFVLGFLFFLFQIRFWMDRSDATARSVFVASMVYLPALLLLLGLARNP